MQEIAKMAADGAANSNPNYIPIFLMMCCIAGGAWLFKWLVGRLEAQTGLLAELVKECNEGREKVAAIVAANSAHVQECTSHIRENTEFLRRCDDRLTDLQKK